MILESGQIKELKFTFNGKKESIIGSIREILRKFSNYCFNNGVEFKTLSEEEVIDKISKTTLTKSSFHKLPNGQYIGGFDNANVAYIEGICKKWLDTVGDIKDISLSDIVSTEIDRIKKFGEVENNKDLESNKTEKVDKIKIFSKNPFRQSICVLGESGAGKSTTLEHILEFEGHEFEFIIPSASTTGLLSQFSPSRSGYIPSRLGKMIVEAFNNPTTLYTAVFDECHKSNVIEMINDELLQAISTKRNMGKRFISLDEDTSELYKGVETFRGNILIPDNFGFIFISSKPRIIANNTDFFNRVELVLLTESDRDMSTSDELLSKVLPEEEKIKLASTRND
jgi:hypothetical protein